MNNLDKHMLGHFLLRVTIGLLFLVAGINKFLNPDGVIKMLSGIGFPIAPFFAWLLLLSEIVFGALILVGYKVKFTAWPLAIVLAVAWMTVTVPFGVQEMGLFKSLTSTNSFFHLIGIAGLVTLALSGPGNW